MTLKFHDLWRWDGTIDRGPYLLIGLLGFGIKHNLDRLLATWGFGRKWDVFNYWISPVEAVRFTQLSPADQRFLAAMLALSLPFIWVGVVLTVRRLRAVGLARWLVLLFFVPVVNLGFFILLSLLPSRAGHSPAGVPVPGSGRLARWVPRTAVGSATASLLLTIPVGVAATLFGTNVLEQYGWGLFIGLPFAQGLVAALLYAYHGSRSYAGCLLVAWLCVLFTALVIFALAAEGLICLVMALPSGVVLAAIGASLGYLIRARPFTAAEPPGALLLLILYVPGVMGAEAAFPESAPLYFVRTAVEIRATPAAVWQRVVAFSEIPEPDDWVFRLGIAYPIRARLHGEGVGAVRYCEFSTGAFIEPIIVWDEPRLLRFKVVSTPSPMEEWTLYDEVRPPHLEGFLLSRGGEFRLIPLAQGRVRLEGTTWYEHNLWPAFYWRWWGDWLIHRIHHRVLAHIKLLVEAETSPLAGEGNVVGASGAQSGRGD